MALIGHKPTEYCGCGVELTDDTWYPSDRARGSRRCNACHYKKDRVRALCDKIVGSRATYRALPREERREIMNTAKRMYELGADFGTAQKAEEHERRGFVYVIKHPAFPGYVKIGRAFDPDGRLTSFQTGCPTRSYELHYAAYFENCYAAEKFIHETLADYRAEGEWFRLLPSVAEEHIESLGGYL